MRRLKGDAAKTGGVIAVGAVGVLALPDEVMIEETKLELHEADVELPRVNFVASGTHRTISAVREELGRSDSGTCCRSCC